MHIHHNYICMLSVNGTLKLVPIYLCPYKVSYGPTPPFRSWGPFPRETYTPWRPVLLYQVFELQEKETIHKFIINKRIEPSRALIPSCELTYPIQKAVGKMSFLSHWWGVYGYVSSLEGLFFLFSSLDILQVKVSSTYPTKLTKVTRFQRVHPEIFRPIYRWL